MYASSPITFLFVHGKWKTRIISIFDGGGKKTLIFQPKNYPKKLFSDHFASHYSPSRLTSQVFCFESPLKLTFNEHVRTKRPWLRFEQFTSTNTLLRKKGNRQQMPFLFRMLVFLISGGNRSHQGCQICLFSNQNSNKGKIWRAL
jgi:hypothetical protein